MYTLHKPFVLKDKYGKIIKRIQSDKGSEFLNKKSKVFTKEKYRVFASENEDNKCSIV